MSDALDQLRDILSNPEPYKGLKQSFVSPKGLNTQQRGSHWSGTIEWGAPPHGDGIYADDWNIGQLLKADPSIERDGIKLFAALAKRSSRDFEAHAKKLLLRDPYRVREAFVGWQDSENWGEPTNIKVSGFQIGKPRVESGRAFKAPWSVNVEFDMEPLAAVTSAPFSEMSDRELDKYIDAFSSDAPENYHMDGEWQGSARTLRQHWRNRFRKMSPREQVRQKVELEKHHRLASRVANRWLR